MVPFFFSNHLLFYVQMANIPKHSTYPGSLSRRRLRPRRLCVQARWPADRSAGSLEATTTSSWWFQAFPKASSSIEPWKGIESHKYMKPPPTYMSWRTSTHTQLAANDILMRSTKPVPAASTNLWKPNHSATSAWNGSKFRPCWWGWTTDLLLFFSILFYETSRRVFLGLANNKIQVWKPFKSALKFPPFKDIVFFECFSEVKKMETWRSNSTCIISRSWFSIGLPL